LRKRFDLPISKNDADIRIVVVETEGVIIGMIVDSVLEVLRIHKSAIEPPAPIVANIDSAFIKGVAKVDDRLIIMLDVHEVLTTQEKKHLNDVSNKRAMLEDAESKKTGKNKQAESESED
jgi:purine-binding chemotaxis protein CheW